MSSAKRGSFATRARIYYAWGTLHSTCCAVRSRKRTDSFPRSPQSKEFELIRLLMAHAGRPIHYSRLAELCLGYGI